MDFLTTLSYIFAVIETGSLIAALVYAARAMHEKKIMRTRQGKKGGKNREMTEKAASVSKVSGNLASKFSQETPFLGSLSCLHLG